MRCHHSVKQCALRARSTHDVHHAIVGVNVVIGVLVVHCELHVVVRVHVPLVDVCDEAVVRRTLGLIALVVIVVFVVAIFHRILLYWRYTVYSAWSPSRELKYEIQGKHSASDDSGRSSARHNSSFEVQTHTACFLNEERHHE